jgi:hypothetical protein
VLHTVIETSIFSRRADALLSREERADLITTLARDPGAETSFLALVVFGSCASRRKGEARVVRFG